MYDELIADQINDTINAARETLSKTGYTPNDIERIVWVGDATHYKPLRDKIAFELGIKGDTLDVNPITALPYTESSTLADEILGLLNPSEEHLIEGHLIEIDNLMEVSMFLGFDKLSPIARANLLAARMLRLPDYTPDIVVKWIIAIVHAFEGINPEGVRVILNKERSTSDFPEITELPDIASEIQNLRHYYKQVIKFVLENILSAKERVKAVMMVVESVTDSDTNHWPILIEDTVDAYEVGAETFLEIEQNNLKKHDQKLRIAAEKEEPETTFARMVGEFIQTVKDWSIIAQPILLKKKRQGLRHETSHRVETCVRQLAIHLFNEYDKLNFSQQILNTLKEVFTNVPEINDLITVDIETLKKIANLREQKN